MKKLILCIITVVLIALGGTTILAEEYKGIVSDDFIIGEFNLVTEETEAFEFLRYLDIDNLFILYYDGTMVNEKLQEQVIQKLGENDFSGVMDLVSLHSISFLEKTSLDTGRLRWQEYSFEFRITTPHTLQARCSHGHLRTLIGVSVVSGAVTHHANGTWTGSGRPIVSPQFTMTGWHVERVTSGNYVPSQNGRAISAVGDFQVSKRQNIAGAIGFAQVVFPRVSFNYRIDTLTNWINHSLLEY